LGLAVVFGAAAALITPMSGHSQAKVVARTQPAKLAAFEGLYKTTAGAPLSLFGLPDDERREIRFGVAAPKLLSFLVSWHFDSTVTGLEAFRPEDLPPVRLSYFFYHGMIAVGMALAGLYALALWRLRSGRIFQDRLLLWALIGSAGLAAAANQLGWCAAEVGRQPWVVYGLLRTSDAVSKSVPAAHVLTSIIFFGLIYALIFAVWAVVLAGKIAQGPSEES